jgi:hypothetical protein
MSVQKAIGLVRQWASFGAQENWMPSGISTARNARLEKEVPLKYSYRAPSPRKLEPHEVIAKLKARRVSA